MLPSTSPPGGLAPERVPQFVVFGSDDNYQVDGTNWLVNDFYRNRRNPRGQGHPATFDGTPARGSFYVVGLIEDHGIDIRDVLSNAYLEGHEIGNHTYDHSSESSKEDWQHQIEAANEFITQPVKQGGLGIPTAEVYGFRAPQDAYNSELYELLDQLDFTYDASIVEGYQPDKDGTNEFWPYTLDQGSPAADWMFKSGFKDYTPPGKHPGLWEIPVDVYRIPPELQPKYGDWAYGCDWNWITELDMAPKDMVTIFKHNLDLRLKSNRAPLTLCIHSQFFGKEPGRSEQEQESTDALRKALSQMLDYALSKAEVRVVPAIDVIRWMSNPVLLGGR
jgi:peptidoglycan/xylan/chitin deacetylase (PgdA/CDA1 family)